MLITTNSRFELSRTPALWPVVARSWFSPVFLLSGWLSRVPHGTKTKRGCIFHGCSSREITLQISPWQSGSYSASLYVTISSGIASFPPRSLSLAAYYTIIYLPSGYARWTFPAGVTESQQPRSAACSIREISSGDLEGEAFNKCCTRGMEHGMPHCCRPMSLHGLLGAEYSRYFRENGGGREREREISQTALSRVIISRCPRLFPYVSCEAENGTGTFSGVPLVSREKLETLN